MAGTSQQNPTKTFYQAQLVLEEVGRLNEAVNVEERDFQKKFERAFEVFDHSFFEVHNKILICGADQLLVEQLCNATAEEEMRFAIRPICKLLSMLYRCDDQHFQDSTAVVGGDLFPALFAAYFICIEEGGNPGGDILNLTTRMNDINLDLRDVPWADDLLDLFQEVIETLDPSHHTTSLSVVLGWLNKGILLSRENNKRYVMNHRTFCDSIISCFASTFRPDCFINQSIGVFIKSLSLATSNRVLMVLNDDYFRLIFLLLHDDSFETRKEAFSTLTLLSLDRGGRTKAFNFLYHKFVHLSSASLSILELCASALEFIIILATHLSGKEILFSCPTLANDLSVLSVQNKQCSLKAAQTLVAILKTISISNGHGDALDAILLLCRAKDEDIRQEGVQALLDQSKSKAGCCFFIAHSTEALSAVSALVVDENAWVQNLAIRVVSTLSRNTLSGKRVAKHITLLENLIIVATTDQSKSPETSANAALAIQRLLRYHECGMEGSLEIDKGGPIGRLLPALMQLNRALV